MYSLRPFTQTAQLCATTESLLVMDCSMRMSQSEHPQASQLQAFALEPLGQCSISGLGCRIPCSEALDRACTRVCEPHCGLGPGPTTS